MLEMVFTPFGGQPERSKVFEFEDGGGITHTQYITDDSIQGSAHASFKMALDKFLPLDMTTKNTILKKYDGRFLEIFQEIYKSTYAKEFEEKEIWHEHRMIDDMVAQNDQVCRWFNHCHEECVPLAVFLGFLNGSGRL